MGQFLETCRLVTGSDASFTWVAESFLLEHEVIAFSELPLWLRKVSQGMLAVSIDKARAAGLILRSLDSIIEETIAWDRSRLTDADEYSQRLYDVEHRAGV